NSRYGIAAFAPNPLKAGYENPLEDVLEKGDLIVRVNEEELNSSLDFDQAIEKAYQNVKNVLDAVNADRLELLENFPYQIRVGNGQSLAAGNATNAKGNLKIEYYRNGELEEITLTFTVNRDGRTLTSPANGNPKIFVELADLGLLQSLLNNPLIPDALFNSTSDGVIFSLNEPVSSGRATGYAGNGFD